MKLSQCGARVVQPRQIVASGFSQEGYWPWHSAIYRKDIDGLKQSYQCGGTLISSNSVLTAAHCLYELDHPIVPKRIIVYLGKSSLMLNETYTQQNQARRIFIHNDFKRDNNNNDIALVRLATAATLTSYVKPICLWEEERNSLSEVIGKIGTVVGWSLNEDSRLTDRLSQDYMPVVSSVICLISDPNLFGSIITDKTFCAGFRNGNCPFIDF